MAKGQQMVTIRNLSGQVQQVASTHPILNMPGVKVIEEQQEPEPVPYEDWAPDDLLRYADEQGIDVGQATSAATLASRIRAAEENA